MKKAIACLLALRGTECASADRPAHRYPGRDTGTHDCKYCAGRGTRSIV